MIIEWSSLYSKFEFQTPKNHKREYYMNESPSDLILSWYDFNFFARRYDFEL